MKKPFNLRIWFAFQLLVDYYGLYIVKLVNGTEENYHHNCEFCTELLIPFISLDRII